MRQVITAIQIIFDDMYLGSPEKYNRSHRHMNINAHTHTHTHAHKHTWRPIVTTGSQSHGRRGICRLHQWGWCYQSQFLFTGLRTIGVGRGSSMHPEVQSASRSSHGWQHCECLSSNREWNLSLSLPLIESETGLSSFILCVHPQ